MLVDRPLKRRCVRRTARRLWRDTEPVSRSPPPLLSQCGNSAPHTCRDRSPAGGAPPGARVPTDGRLDASLPGRPGTDTQRPGFGRGLPGTAPSRTCNHPAAPSRCSPLSGFSMDTRRAAHVHIPQVHATRRSDRHPATRGKFKNRVDAGELPDIGALRRRAIYERPRTSCRYDLKARRH